MTAPSTRGYAKGRARRAEILDAAITLFGEVGYRSASVREIAQRVGISHVALLHHFGGKEELLAAVLAHREERDVEEFGFESAHGLEVLRRLIALVAANAGRPGIVELYCVLSAEATAAGHPAHDYFRERYARVRAVLQGAFEAVAVAGELRPGVDPRAAAAGVIALTDGLQVQWLLDRDSTDMAAELRHWVNGMLVDPL
ncbi:TetR/AcrR family transcriptional regulator [Modestobacter sp. SYSU DS0657]